MFVKSSYRESIQFPPLQWEYIEIKSRKFKKDFESLIFVLTNSQSRFKIRWSDLYPYLNEKIQMTGFEYHSGWAVRIIHLIKLTIILIYRQLYHSVIFFDFIKNL